MPNGLETFIYLDDSAEPRSGLAVFGWIEVEVKQWFSILEKWLTFRSQLQNKFGISVDKEIHASELVHGRGALTRTIPANFRESGPEFRSFFGQHVAELCLKEISSITGLTVHSRYFQHDQANPRESKQMLYDDVALKLTDKLNERNEFAMLFVDGDGSDPMYQKAHRKLEFSARRIFEDPIQLASKHSHFIQIADLVAYCALVSIDKSPNNEFAWNWYDSYLSIRDPKRSPQPYLNG